MSSTQMLLTNLAKKKAKVDSPAETAVRGSLRAFGCRLLMMIGLFVLVSKYFVRSCLGSKLDSEPSMLLFGTSIHFKTAGEFVLLRILCANDEILDTRRYSKVKRLSFSSLLLCRLSSLLLVASFLILNSLNKHMLKQLHKRCKAVLAK